MAKKLLGERQLGDKVFTAGQILSDEEFAASGLTDADVVTTGEVAEPVAAQETAAAPADGDADVDTQGSADAEKNAGQESAQPGSEAGASEAGSEGGAASAEGAAVDTVEHTLTEQDLIDNPDLVAQGHKAGDVVRVPKEEAAQ